MRPQQLLARLQAFSYWHWFAVIALLVGVDYLAVDVSREIDQRGADVLVRWHTPSVPPSTDVVVVDIDQRSLEDMNDPKVNPSPVGNWIWPRSVHGELVEYLARQKPKAIVFDISFSEPDVYRQEHDQAFIDAVASQSNIYFPATLKDDGLGAPMAKVPPAMGFTMLPGGDASAHVPVELPLVLGTAPQAMRGGLVNFAEDSDRVGRHYYLYRDRAGWRMPSLPARVAKDLGWALPDQDRIHLNWRSDWQHIPYVDLYLDAQREKPTRPQNEFTGKVVVIGSAATILQDLRVTPLSSLYPGVDILATAIDNLRAQDWMRDIPRPYVLPFLLLLLAGIASGFERGQSATQIGSRMLVVNLAMLLVAWLALRGRVVLPVYAAIVCGWVYYLLCALKAYLRERQQRERAVGMFQRFLDPRVVRELVASGEVDTGTNAQSREVTVLFSDIRGFTTLSETRSPEAIVSLLNRYFSIQVEIIFRHGGTLDKFIGDAIMAFWGAPVADAAHAQHAIAAAIEMSEALVRFKRELTDLGHDFDIGIGLNSGQAVVGFIGSNDRLDYTAIGDTVNLASRIEGQTKGVARVLVAESTQMAAGDVFAYRDCGVHHVKGREQGVRLFEPLPKEQAGANSATQAEAGGHEAA
ncbi:MAG: adenylate/guanylate cyclase domain-containing protein [Burkholderiales bacterium]|nr:adenylate/guanylate cyclase domain-containing protein [Burkholderiales bacterium]